MRYQTEVRKTETEKQRRLEPLLESMKQEVFLSTHTQQQLINTGMTRLFTVMETNLMRINHQC